MRRSTAIRLAPARSVAPLSVRAGLAARRHVMRLGNGSRFHLGMAVFNGVLVAAFGVTFFANGVLGCFYLGMAYLEGRRREQLALRDRDLHEEIRALAGRITCQDDHLSFDDERAMAFKSRLVRETCPCGPCARRREADESPVRAIRDL